MKRRELIQKLAALGVLPHLNLFSAVLQSQSYAKTASIKKPKTLIVIFQRGAVDGLSMLVPYGDSNYNKEVRPNILIPSDKVIKLNSYFGLNPAMQAFQPLWEKGLLTGIQQVGSPSHSRSHFDSQDFMESGTPDKKSTDTGFLTRALEQMQSNESLKISSLAIQPNLPRIIQGDKKSLSFDSLSNFSIKGFAPNISNSKGFEGFFESALDEVLKGQNKNSLSLLSDFAKAKDTKIETAFPKGQLANHLKDMAKIIKSDIYVPFMVTELGGWDTHVNQGNEEGALANRLKEFSGSIAAFVNEIGPKIEDVTVITITEFGRTFKENGNKGTDHGHGSSFFVINGNLKPKNIVTHWKDLKKENLFEERDVPVTLDFRDVFTEIFFTQFGIKNTEAVFPNFKVSSKLGLYS